MPTLNQLIRNRAVVEIPAEGDIPLRIEYQPAAITSRLMTTLDDMKSRAVTRKEQMAFMVEYLTHVVYGWNLNEPDGTPTPVTPETIAALDYEALTIMFNTISQDAYPGEAQGATSLPPSESTSKPVEPQATKRRPSRTGTR